MNLLSEYSHMTDELQLPKGYTRCKALKCITRDSSIDIYYTGQSYPLKGYVDCYIYEPSTTIKYIMWQRSHGDGSGQIGVSAKGLYYAQNSSTSVIQGIDVNVRRSIYFDYSDSKVKIEIEGKTAEGKSYPDRYVSLGCSTYSNGCLMYVYGLYLVNDSKKMIETYIPAVRNSDGRTGLYRYYYNQTFIAGSSGNNAWEAIF